MKKEKKNVRKVLKTGDVIQFPLPQGLGFGYAQYVNLLEVLPGSSYPDMLRVYNLRRMDELESVSALSERNLILSPLLVGGIAPAISKGAWKVIGNLSPSKDETAVPCYKWGEPVGENPREWYYVVDADITKKIRSRYEAVSHLANFGAIGSDFVPLKVAMAFVDDEGKDIKTYFKLDNYWERYIWEEVKTCSPYYKLPKHLQGMPRL